MLRVRSISAEARNYWALTVRHSEHCIGVDHDTDNKVQGGVADLESEQGLREVLRVLHLRNEGEENDVASIREDLHGQIN